MQSENIGRNTAPVVIGTGQDVCFRPLLWHISRPLCWRHPPACHASHPWSIVWLGRKPWACNWNFDCSFCLLVGLFSCWETLSSFLALLKIVVEFLSYVFNLLFTVLVLVSWKTYFVSFLPEWTSFIFWLMSFGVIDLRSTILMVLTSMVSIVGHVGIERCLLASLPGGVEYPEGLSRVGRLAGFILVVKVDPFAL